MPWTEEELAELQEYFGDKIKKGENVREKDCLRAIDLSKKNHKTLQRRKWDTIKKKVNYIIVKNKKNSNN